MHDIDTIKLRILDELTRDSSRARKQISSELGISESYLSKLIRELIDEDRLIDRFTIQVNYRKLGYAGNYCSLIQIGEQSGVAIDKLADILRNMPEAIEVYTVYGDHDFYVRWLCHDGNELMKKLRSVMGPKSISKITTYALGQEYKREFGPALSIPKDDPE